MKKILIITYYWPPSGGAGVQRWLKFCKYLPDLGYAPIILTLDPEFASYPVIDNSFESEIDDRIKVVRTKSIEPLQWFSKLFGSSKVPYSGFSNVETDSIFSKVSRWVRGNFFIPDARKYWKLYAYEAAVELLNSEEIDLVVTTGPPHSTHLIGQKLKQKFDLNWIADFRDPWTDIYYYNQLYHTKWAKQKDHKMERGVLSDADLILSVCPSNYEMISAKNPNIKHKMALVTNGFDADDFKGLSRAKSDVEFIIAYTGTMAASYNLAPIFKILAQLKFKWKLAVAGVIAPQIKILITQLGIDENVEQLGYLPHKEALQLVYSADLLLHIVPDISGARMGTTGKLFEYIGCGVPIINFGKLEGDSAKFISDSKTGQTFDRENTVDAIKYIVDVQTGLMIFNPNQQLFSRAHTCQELVNAIDSKLMLE